MPTEVKCKMCRKTIISTSEYPDLLVNAHQQPLHAVGEECDTVAEKNLLFLIEDTLPEWILQKVQEVEWSKGKLNCMYCDSRLGGFNFISRSKCQCLKNIVPAVHLIRSKVDVLVT